jgi:hypothetical protein
MRRPPFELAPTLHTAGARRSSTHADAYRRCSCFARRRCRRRSNVVRAAERVGYVLQFTVRLRITRRLLCTGGRRVASMRSGEARLLPDRVRSRISRLNRGRRHADPMCVSSNSSPANAEALLWRSAQARGVSTPADEASAPHFSHLAPDDAPIVRPLRSGATLATGRVSSCEDRFGTCNRRSHR